MVIFVNRFYIQQVFQWLYVIANMRVTRFIVSHSFLQLNVIRMCGWMLRSKFNVKFRIVFIEVHLGLICSQTAIKNINPALWELNSCSHLKGWCPTLDEAKIWIGVNGFEPLLGGPKTSALQTWLYPSYFGEGLNLQLSLSEERSNQLSYNYCPARLALAPSYTEEKFLRLRVYLVRHDRNLFHKNNCCKS